MKRFLPRRRLRLNFTLLAANEFLAEMRLYYPVAVLAFAEVTGSFALAMGVYSTMFITQTLLEIPMGVLSDKRGRRLVLILGCATEFLSTLCYALSFFSSFGLFLVFAGGFFIGVANAAFSGNNNAMLYETLVHYKKPHEIATILGRINAMGQLALASTGVLCALLMALGYSFQDLMIFSLLPLAISWALSLFTIEPPRLREAPTAPTRHLAAALRLMIQNPRLAWFSGASALNLALSNASNGFTPAFVAALWPAWLTPLYRTGQHILGSVSFWFAGSVAKKFGERPVLLFGTLVSKILSLAAYLSSFFLSPLLLMLTQISYAVTRTADSSLQQKMFSDEQRSTMGSVISLTGAVLGAGVSILLGALADIIGPAYALAVFAFLALPTAFLYWKMGAGAPLKTNHFRKRPAKTP